MKNNKKSMTYRDAGVDIDAGNQLIEKIKPFVAKTHRLKFPIILTNFSLYKCFDKKSSNKIEKSSNFWIYW